MRRAELEKYILETYGAEAAWPWMKYPNYEVFRHCGNQKWFALIMDVPRAKLGASGEGILDVVNLKCDPIMIGDLLSQPGFFPAYHMSKDNWITAALDGSVEDDKFKLLLDLSYDLTNTKVKRPKVLPDP